MIDQLQCKSTRYPEDQGRSCAVQDWHDPGGFQRAYFGSRCRDQTISTLRLSSSGQMLKKIRVEEQVETAMCSRSSAGCSDLNDERGS